MCNRRDTIKACVPTLGSQLSAELVSAILFTHAR